MLNGVWHNPTKILFGRDSERHVGEEVAMHAKKVLLHYGGDTVKRLGLHAKVMTSLREAGVEVIELGGVVPNPRASLVHEGIHICRQEHIEFILALGGGSVIDSAKAIALGVPYDGDFYDFTKGVQPTEALKVASVLTIPGAGSESSPAAVINHEEFGQKCSYVTPLIIPIFSILNPEYTTTINPYLTSAGIVDAISHLFERYFTNTESVDTTDRIAAGLIQTLMKYGVSVLENPEDYDIRAEIMWACKLAHDDTAGFGRKQDWACHSIAHEIAAIHDSVHGATLAVVFPAWMEFVSAQKSERFALFSEQVMGIDAKIASETKIKMGIRKYREFLKQIGMPVSLNDLGVSDRSQLKLIAEKSVQYMASGTLGNFCRLTPADIEQILLSAFQTDA